MPCMLCMGGLGCLFAAESNGIVQSLLRVVEVEVDIGSRRALTRRTI